jgi:uncharacterized protein with PhoU and TrkA domain
MKKTINRGTKVIDTDDSKKGFIESQNDIKAKAGDVFISTGRGTGKTKLSDIADSKEYSTKGRKRVTGRGTGITDS